MPFSEWIRAEGCTQRAVARRLGVSPSTLSRLLRGERSPSASLMRRVFELTEGKVTPTDLVVIPSPRSEDRAA